MKKVLIIEGDEIFRWLLSEFLISEGLEVLTAWNGSLGLCLARKQRPDLILCAVHIPELNGFEVLRELRVDSTTTNLPFIFLTTVDKPSSCEQAMQLGANDYLIKPIDLKHLSRIITVYTQPSYLFELTDSSYRPSCSISSLEELKTMTN